MGPKGELHLVLAVHFTLKIDSGVQWGLIALLMIWISSQGGYGMAEEPVDVTYNSNDVDIE